MKLLQSVLYGLTIYLSVVFNVLRVFYYIKSFIMPICSLGLLLKMDDIVIAVFLNRLLIVSVIQYSYSRTTSKSSGTTMPPLKCCAASRV